MRRALELAARGRGRTRPNPMVGAVLVRDGQVVGEGFHRRAGGPHAEREALAAAGTRARGATLYVSWEPCVTFPGKRTPACAEALIAAGVRRAVIACLDPDPRVHGRGVARLRAAGVEVEVGLLEGEARALNEVTFIRHGRGRPFVCLKWAMTLDGKIATVTGDARWITGEPARRRVHELRATYAAVLVGVETVLRDDPALTVRHVPGEDPWRIVLDARGRTPPEARLLKLKSAAPTVIATTATMPEAVERALAGRGARVWRLEEEDGRVSLPALLEALKAHELDSVLVEGGGEVHASFLRAGLVDKVICFLAPKLLGGREAPGPVGGRGLERVAEALRLERLTVERLGEDLVVMGYLVR